jgi:hypothetical protein
MTLPRALLLACLALSGALACGSGSSCTEASPLDCANGACCDPSHAFQCGSRCWVSASLAADNGCATSVVCKSGDATACYADWSCGTDANCAAAMGGSRGATGPFGSSFDCDAWRSQHAVAATCICR